MESELLEYSSRLSLAREVFLLNYPQEFQAFEDTNKRLLNIGEVVSQKRSNQNESLVGLGPFLLIIARQAINAFECLSRYQSYQTWIVLRPALEATLIIGKFLDDDKNVELWRNRRKIWESRKRDKETYKRYREEFEGKGLIPKSLQHGKEFRELLSRINDEFIHVNYNYFERSYTVVDIDAQSVLIKIPLIDEDVEEYKAYLFSFLHMYRLMGSSLGRALASKYSKEEALNVEMESVEKIWKPRVEELVKEKPVLKELCRTFGLWKI